MIQMEHSHFMIWCSVHSSADCNCSMRVTLRKKLINGSWQVSTDSAPNGSDGISKSVCRHDHIVWSGLDSSQVSAVREYISLHWTWLNGADWYQSTRMESLPRWRLMKDGSLEVRGKTSENGS